MVDSTTLIVISTVVQTVVITTTLVVFILQFRSQERATREASYQGLMGRYNDFISKMVDKPELTRNVMVGMRGRSGDEEFSTEDAAVFGHLLAAYGIIEEAYLLYAKNWMDEENWLQWFEWLRIISEHPLFPRMAAAAVGTFDKDFEELVSREVLSKKAPARGAS